MKLQDLTLDRIERRGVCADDIKHARRLSKDQICDIPFDHVFMWVKTGKWKQKDFKKWLQALDVL